MHSFIHAFTMHACIHSFSFPSCINSLIDGLINLSIHSLLTHSFIHSFVHSCLLYFQSFDHQSFHVTLPYPLHIPSQAFQALLGCLWWTASWADPQNQSGGPQGELPWPCPYHTDWILGALDAERSLQDFLECSPSAGFCFVHCLQRCTWYYAVRVSWQLPCLQAALEQSCLVIMVKRKKDTSTPCPWAGTEEEPQDEVHWAFLGDLHPLEV